MGIAGERPESIEWMRLYDWLSPDERARLRGMVLITRSRLARVHTVRGSYEDAMRQLDQLAATGRRGTVIAIISGE